MKDILYAIGALIVIIAGIATGGIGFIVFFVILFLFNAAIKWGQSGETEESRRAADKRAENAAEFKRIQRERNLTPADKVEREEKRIKKLEAKRQDDAIRFYYMIFLGIIFLSTSVYLIFNTLNKK